MRTKYKQHDRTASLVERAAYQLVDARLSNVFAYSLSCCFSRFSKRVTVSFSNPFRSLTRLFSFSQLVATTTTTIACVNASVYIDPCTMPVWTHYKCGVGNAFILCMCTDCMLCYFAFLLLPHSLATCSAVQHTAHTKVPIQSVSQSVVVGIRLNSYHIIFVVYGADASYNTRSTHFSHITNNSEACAQKILPKNIISAFAKHILLLATAAQAAVTAASTRRRESNAESEI